MKLLVFLKYGDKVASTRQRLLQFDRYLFCEGIEVVLAPLLSNNYIEQKYCGRRPSASLIAKAYAARIGHLIGARNYDAIWVHCESFPYLPGFVERLAVGVGRPLVYDFDDAVFHQYDAHANPLIRYFLGKKLEPLLRGASICICGNAYLKAYADKFCQQTVVVPTVVDIDVYKPRPNNRSTVTVGWIGTPSTWEYFKMIVPTLRRLAEELGIRVGVVGAGGRRLPDAGFEFVEWTEEGEVAAIQEMDIGVMPLPDDPWARGKCGYKLVQYMACGVPVVASPVGVNCQIVDDGVNGFLARDEGEWVRAIRCLCANPELRLAMGAHGRRKIVESYSLQTHGPRLAGLVRGLVCGGASLKGNYTP